MPRIAVDFDGVLAYYTPGMASRDEVGQPLKGAVSALRKLKRDCFYIIIWTSRPVTNNLRKWFDNYCVPYDEIVSKPDCNIFVDDRAISFNGDWEKTLAEIEKFKEWWK